MEDCVWEGDGNCKQKTTLNLQQTETKSLREKGLNAAFYYQVGAKLRREQINPNFFRSQLLVNLNSSPMSGPFVNSCPVLPALFETSWFP